MNTQNICLTFINNQNAVSFNNSGLQIMLLLKAVFKMCGHDEFISLITSETKHLKISLLLYIYITLADMDGLDYHLLLFNYK